MTEPTLLDESAMSKIEARIAKRDDTSALESACGEYNCSCHYDLPALCATVKHLRAKHEQLALASGEWASLLDRIRAWSKCSDGYPLDEHINNIAVDRERLQSQLEQLRADVDKFSTLADERHDLLSVERRANDSLRQHVDESMRTNEKLTARNVELRQQLAQVEQERDTLREKLLSEKALDSLTDRTLKPAVHEAIKKYQGEMT